MLYNSGLIHFTVITLRTFSRSRIILFKSYSTRDCLLRPLATLRFREHKFYSRILTSDLSEYLSCSWNFTQALKHAPYHSTFAYSWPSANIEVNRSRPLTNGHSLLISGSKYPNSGPCILPFFASSFSIWFEPLSDDGDICHRRRYIC